MITSESNGQVKELVKLQTSARERRKRQLFVVEGEKMVREAAQCGKLQMIFFSEDYRPPEKDAAWLSGDISREVLSRRVFQRVADTVTPQGVLGVAQMPSDGREKMLGDARRAYLLLDDLQDPGNLGTILRTAEGAGMSGVIMSRGTVDVFNPKVIRSTMGSVFRIPFCQEENLCDAVRALQDRDIPVYGTVMQGSAVYDQVDYTRGAGIVVGNEGRGISREVMESVTCGIRIPMEGRLESLNASVAAAVLMYEMARQRRL